MSEKMKRRVGERLACAGVLAAAGAWLAGLSAVAVWLRLLVLAIAAVPLCASARAALRCWLRTRALAPIVWAACFACAFVLGKQVLNTDAVTWRGLTVAAGQFCALFVLSACAALALCGLRTASLMREAWATPRPTRVFWCAWLVIFLCYVPYLLLRYPAALSYDSMVQLEQVTGIAPLSNQHPLAHTLLISAVYHALRLLGAPPRVALAGFTVLQMLGMSGVFAATVAFIARRVRRAWPWCLALAWFALNPIHAFHSVTVWKNVPWSACVLALMLVLYRIAETRETAPVRVVPLFLLALAVCLLQNTGVPVVTFLALCALGMLRRARRRVVGATLCAVLVSLVLTGPIAGALDIAKPHTAEMMSVPIQQIGRAMQYPQDRLTPDQRARLERYLPIDAWQQSYHYAAADNIKFHPAFQNEALDSDPAAFLALWASLLPKYPAAYVMAYLTHSVAYWHPTAKGDTLLVMSVNYPWPGLEIFDTRSLLPGHQGLSVDINGLRERSLELLSPFFSIGWMLWCAALAAMLLLRARQPRFLLVLMPLLGNWLAVMLAAPTRGETRYLYAAFTALPVVVLLALGALRGEDAGEGDAGLMRKRSD